LLCDVRMRCAHVFALLLAGLSVSGCYRSHERAGSDAGPPPRDGSVPDARRDADLLPVDAAPVDAAPFDAPPVDASLRDATPPDLPDAHVPPLPPCPVLAPRPEPSDRVGLLRWQQTAIVGLWSGTRTSPWESPPPAVELTFLADGTYRARCLGSASCVPFYWGDLAPGGPNARYALVDTTASGSGEGRLAPVWDGDAAWEGRLDDVVLDEAGLHLAMRFFDPAGRGPLVFSLDRVCE
jgi:hypothetical protein